MWQLVEPDDTHAHIHVKVARIT